SSTTNILAATAICPAHFEMQMVQESVEDLRSLFDRPNVHIRDREGTIARLNGLIDGGARDFTVISDFDHTLSRSHDANGRKCAVTHEVFGHPERFPDLCEKFAIFEKKYGSFEHLTEGQERFEKMEAWWRESNAAIAERAVHRKELPELVAATNIQLRDGAAELIGHLEQREVPALIFSAGIGDIITVVLEQHLGRIPPNVHVVSNMMAFDEQDRNCGFSHPIIHCFNKSGAMIDKHSPVLPLISSRPHILLLGDALGDLGMAEGLSKEETSGVRIGFLN
ncbi:hypothetical protein PMAYCL1PPCAC_10029, partial [Pristionchus mayeri]